jgi:2-dehydro-3-deoxy-D-gluconate 5-dehydrogenase
MSNPFHLRGQVAIVTGGNGGIGLGMALGLARSGAGVVVVGRNAEKNDRAMAALRAANADVAPSAVIADVTQERDCAAIVAHTLDRHGRIDVLVNNAGTNVRKAPQDYSLDEWQMLIDANLTSAFLCSKAVYPAMAKARRGKIINIGSMTSIFGASFAAPYGASKGGVVQFTMATAVAWARDNIQVNAVLPGWIDTDLTVQARKDVEGLHERVEARTPAGRWGVPQDFAGIAVFLASAASDFITGVAIPVDGGYSAQG